MTTTMTPAMQDSKREGRRKVERQRGYRRQGGRGHQRNGCLSRSAIDTGAWYRSGQGGVTMASLLGALNHETHRK